MGLLDKLEGAAKGIYHTGDTFVGAVTAPLGFALDVATSPWNDDEDYNGFWNTLMSRGIARFGDAMEPTDDLLGGSDEWIGRNVLTPTLDTLNTAREYAVSRPLATTQLLGEASERRYGDHRGLGALSIPFDPSVWNDAWNLSDDISPGQAAVAGLAEGLGSANRATIGRPLLPGNLQRLADADFDITNPTERDAVFKHGLGRLASGATDAVLAWKYDPTVLIGAGAGAVRTAKFVRPVDETTDVTAALARDDVADFIKTMRAQGSPEEQMNWLMRNRSIRSSDDGSAVAWLLAHGATDDATAYAMLRHSMTASVRTQRKLQARNIDLDKQLSMLTDVRIPSLERALNRAAPDSPVEAFATRRLALANAALRDADHEKQLTAMMMRAEGSMRMEPRVTLGQKAATGVRERAGVIGDKVGWQAYQPSPYNYPLRIAKAATTMRAGVVDLNRPDSVNTLRQFLDGARLDNDTKGRFLSQFTAAASPAARQDVIHAAESRAVEALAGEHGISVETLRRLYVDGFVSRRTQTMKLLSERAYSGAKTADGRLADMVDVDGVATRLPLDVPDLQDYVPLLDLAGVRKVLRRYDAQIRADEGGFINAIRGVRASKTAQFATEMSVEIADTFNRIWKPLQLARLGYPIRVLADEQVRSAAILGTISQLGLVVEAGVKHQTKPFLVGAAHRATLTGTRRSRELVGLERTVARLDDQIANGVEDSKEVADLIARRAEYAHRRDVLVAKLSSVPTSRFGEGTLNLRGRDAGAGDRPWQRSGKYEVGDAFGRGGDEGANIFKPLSESKPMWASLADTNGAVLNGIRAARSRSWVNLLPDQPGYGQAWERAVNRQIRNSAPMRMMLEGRTDDEVLRWLRTKEGRAYAKQIPVRSRRPEEWVESMRAHVETYLPGPHLKELALRGEAKATDLARVIPERSQRPLIHGESLDVDTGNSAVMQFIDKRIEKVYSTLGAAPTDVLSRHPFFAGVYRAEVDRLVRRYDDTHLSLADLEVIEKRAREYALRKTKTTLYELGAESDLSHAVRFIMPFYSAWQEVLTRWIGMTIEDPSRLAHGIQMWRAPNNAGMVVDKDGNPATDDTPADEQYIVANVPGFLRKLPGFDTAKDMKISKQSLNTILTGDNPFAPGVGPMVAIPVAEAVRRRPDMAESMELILPFGAGKDALDLALPAAYKRVRSMSTEDRAYWNSLVRISQELEFERSRGIGAAAGMDDTALAHEAESRAKAYWKMRAVSNLVLPTSPQYQSPYQFWMDQARKYRELYEAKPGGVDEQGRTWDEAYLDDFGSEYFVFTASLSKSVNSVAPTIEGYHATQKFGDLLERNPDLGSLIVGDADSGVFDQNVYDWQFGADTGPGTHQKMRETKDVRESLDDTQRREGWIMWRRADRVFRSILEARGLTDFNQSGAEDVSMMRTEVRRKLGEQYVPWRRDMEAFDTGAMSDRVAKIKTFIDDPRFDDRPGWQSLRKYIAARDMISAALLARDRAGGSISLQAKSNTDLRTMFSAIGAKLRSEDTTFSELHARWFSYDEMNNGG